MGRYIGPVCRLCRREGMKLFLKGERCFTEKCAIERRSYPPGQHGHRRSRKSSNYGPQLREKQKVKRIYGILERQFRNYFKRAERQRGVTGENLLSIIERRLDNVVYRLGFAFSRRQARQLVAHGHIEVDGKKVTIPSYLVKPGQKVSVRQKSRDLEIIKQAIEGSRGRGVPEWLSVNIENFEGEIVRIPRKDDINLPIQEQLIVEFYSR